MLENHHHFRFGHKLSVIDELLKITLVAVLLENINMVRGHAVIVVMSDIRTDFITKDPQDFDFTVDSLGHARFLGYFFYGYDLDTYLFRWVFFVIS